MHDNILEENIEKLESVIQTISKSRTISRESTASKRVQELKEQREELDSTSVVINPKIIEEQKIIIGKTIVENFGEENFMKANFTENLLAIISSNKEQLIFEIKGKEEKR